MPRILPIVFASLITVQLLFMAVHDWIHIEGWTHGGQVSAAIGRNKMIVGTAINCLFPGTAAVLAWMYVGRPAPTWAENYWLIYCGITGFGAITSWWIPYFFGTNEKTTQLYKQMYAGTKQVLPARGDNPRPNLLHIYFHCLFLVTLVLAVMLRMR